MIIGGAKNPHRAVVAKDITDAILKTHANKGVSATYWKKEDQAHRLTEAYGGIREGGVWSAAASKVRIMFNRCKTRNLS